MRDNVWRFNQSMPPYIKVGKNSTFIKLLITLWFKPHWLLPYFKIDVHRLSNLLHTLYINLLCLVTICWMTVTWKNYDTFFKSKHIVNNSYDFDKKFGLDIESRFKEISKYNNSVNSLLEKWNNSQVSYCDVSLGEPIKILNINRLYD